MREPMNRTDGMEIDLQKLLRSCLYQWWRILLCGVLAAGAAFLYTNYCVTPLYRASVTIYVNNTRSGAYVDHVSGSNLSASKQLVSTYLHILQSDAVLEKVAERAELECTPADIRERMSAAQVDDTELFEVHIVHADPEMAARIANAIAMEALEEIGKFVEGSSAKIVDHAAVPEQYDTPDYKKNVLFGGLVGCAAALAAAALRYLMDTRIKDEEELAQLLDVPVLGQIPVFGQSGKTSSHETEGAEDLCLPQCDLAAQEAYKMLRTKVMHALAGENGGKVVMVTSALRGEGKSVTAVNLALSCAQADRRVLLIDCDLRYSKLAHLLSLEAPVGLSGLIRHPEEAERAIIHAERLGLDVILAGDVPTNPSELLGSAGMGRLLEMGRRKYDYIILDTPPVNLVTDGAVLASNSDGVLFVVRANQSECKEVLRGVEQLEYVEAKIQGIVLNGVVQRKHGGS